MTLIALGVAQLNILRGQFNNILENAGTVQEHPNKRLEDATEDILRRCINLHKAIIQYVDKLNNLLAFPLFVQYISGCFAICNTIVRITILRDSDVTALIGLGSYTCLIFAQMAIYHWLANEIIFNSVEVSESCYISTWYEMDIRHQRSLLLVMQRSQRPLMIQLYGFIDISLQSFGVVIRWSYSLFALIKVRYN
ncbi:hypothetical protein Trydic_g4255 [Trypoxylus dichotomus]